MTKDALFFCTPRENRENSDMIKVAQVNFSLRLLFLKVLFEITSAKDKTNLQNCSLLQLYSNILSSRRLWLNS